MLVDFSSSDHLRSQTYTASCDNFVLALRFAAVLALQERLPVLVELDTSDDTLGRGNANRHCLAICLVTGHTLNMNDPLLAVDLYHFALAVMVVSTDNHHFVVFADGQ